MSLGIVDFDQTTKYGDTALDLAIKNNKLESIEALLSGGAKIEKFDGTVLGVSSTPLILAVNLSKLEVVKLLLKYKPDVNILDSLGYTPLQNLFSKPRYNKVDLEIAKLLVEHGANIDVITPDGKKLEDLVRKGKKPELIDLLKECYAKNEEKQKNNITVSKSFV
ncbi:Putative LmrCD-specific DARPin [Candidatus Phycorickettsia trachydisci]|uniref:LmrCD-specific DARPin n=1 Tax=Candidatus Phycorickettsia trachydisci TaxID=2115978 RepID=A0A2P1P7S9_9RICK|nr:ankyrin repeat domain-containing protein [Candidatus Phycorickettsia trachydisci]AVP87330.1 Putative LmrCD-specific DARPin [Candidatus Phycorickettsia trachydisci]